MSNWPILDLVVGMVFVYFLLSIMCSSAVEMVLTGGDYRSKMLEEWLTTILKEKVTQPNGKEMSLGQSIMDHYSVTALSGDSRSPAYIDSANFASALLERVSFDPNNPAGVPQQLTDYIAALQKTKSLDPELQRVFISYAFEAQATFAALTTKAASEIDLFKGKIENWFDTNMDRVSGQLKTKYSRPVTFVVAALTALALNADSVAIAKYLYNNPEARTQIAASAYEAAHNDNFRAMADNITKTHPAQKDSGITYQQINDTLAARWKEINTARAALDDNSIPLGWNRNECKKSSSLLTFILTKFVGLFATFFAISMGAPFWFDILNKISNLRGTGKKPATNKKSKK